MKSVRAYQDVRGDVHATKEKCAAANLVELMIKKTLTYGGAGTPGEWRAWDAAEALVTNRKEVIEYLRDVDADEEIGK